VTTSGPRGSQKTGRSWIRVGDQVHHMACKRGDGEEGEQKVEDVHRLHRP